MPQCETLLGGSPQRVQRRISAGVACRCAPSDARRAGAAKPRELKRDFGTLPPTRKL